VNDLKDSNIELSIKDIIIIGSNANYNYTKDSDIDIHIITEKSSLKCDEKIAEALYGAYRSIFNGKYEINFYDIPVELYVEIEDSPRVSNGIYSVKQEK
jgi:predicted nucleotidyltransferase